MDVTSGGPGVAVIVQARMGSSRLPGKTLADLGGRPVIDWVVNRCRAAGTVGEVIVATTDRSEDDPLVAHLEERGVPVVRGSSDDVLDRYRVALASTDAELLVRVTGDCPFVSPEIIDLGVAALLDGDADYAATGLDGRFPRGLDAEVVRRAALLEASEDAVDGEEREHVTLFIYRRRDRFSCVPIDAPAWVLAADVRFTVDEPVDLEVAREVVGGLGDDVLVPAQRVIEHLRAHPDLAARNADVEHRNVDF